MPVTFWIHDTNTDYIRSTRKFRSQVGFERLLQFGDIILRGTFQSKDELMARTSYEGSSFVRGEVLAWDAVRDSRCLYVKVEEGELRPKPLIMTGYHHADVHYHKRKRLISEKSEVEREEFMPGTNLVISAFNTFDFIFGGRRKEGYTPRFLLYDATGQVSEFGNITNPTKPENLQAAIAKRKQQERLTDVSTVKVKI